MSSKRYGGAETCCGLLQQHVADACWVWGVFICRRGKSS